jgi:hypothetical protein
MRIETRLERLEAAMMPPNDNPENMTNSDLMDGLRRMFRADPHRRWEDDLGAAAGGYSIQTMLAEVRQAANPPAQVL